jgi:hypothetical protein
VKSRPLREVIGGASGIEDSAEIADIVDVLTRLSRRFGAGWSSPPSPEVVRPPA